MGQKERRRIEVVVVGNEIPEGDVRDSDAHLLAARGRGPRRQGRARRLATACADLERALADAGIAVRRD